MGEEKTIEELQAELEALRKANLERELELEKAKLEEAKKLEKEEKEKELYEQIKQKVISELDAESKVTNDEDETNVNLSEEQEWFEKFSERYKQRLGLKGLKYEELCEKLAMGGY